MDTLSSEPFMAHMREGSLRVVVREVLFAFSPQKSDATEEQRKNADQVSRMLSVTLRCAYSPENPWRVLDGWEHVYSYVYEQETGIRHSYPYLTDVETQELFANFWQQDILPNDRARACLQDPAIYDPITDILMSNTQSASSVSPDIGLPFVMLGNQQIVWAGSESRSDRTDALLDAVEASIAESATGAGQSSEVSSVDQCRRERMADRYPQLTPEEVPAFVRGINSFSARDERFPSSHLFWFDVSSEWGMTERFCR